MISHVGLFVYIYHMFYTWFCVLIPFLVFRSRSDSRKRSRRDSPHDDSQSYDDYSGHGSLHGNYSGEHNDYGYTREPRRQPLSGVDSNTGVPLNQFYLPPWVHFCVICLVIIITLIFNL